MKKATVFTKFLGESAYYSGGVNDKDKPHGVGKMSFANGDSMEGIFENGLPELGIYRFASDTSLSVRFTYNRLKTKCKKEYSGRFSIREPYNAEEILYKDARYVGEVKDGKPFGVGTVKFFNGNVYTGGFVNGKKHGVGKMQYANGKVEYGVYENDKYKSSILSEKPNNIDAKQYEIVLEDYEYIDNGFF